MSGKFYFYSLIPYYWSETGVALLSSIESICLLFYGAFIDYAGLFYAIYLTLSGIEVCYSLLSLFCEPTSGVLL